MTRSNSLLASSKFRGRLLRWIYSPFLMFFRCTSLFFTPKNLCYVFQGKLSFISIQTQNGSMILKKHLCSNNMLYFKHNVSFLASNFPLHIHVQEKITRSSRNRNTCVILIFFPSTLISEKPDKKQLHLYQLSKRDP